MSSESKPNKKRNRVVQDNPVIGHHYDEAQHNAVALLGAAAAAHQAAGGPAPAAASVSVAGAPAQHKHIAYLPFCPPERWHSAVVFSSLPGRKNEIIAAHPACTAPGGHVVLAFGLQYTKEVSLLLFVRCACCRVCVCVC